MRERQTEVVPRFFSPSAKFHVWQRAFSFPSAPETGGFFYDFVRRTQSPRPDGADHRRREIIDLINNGKATFYIGFDCTADSLTAGHFMALTLMKRLQMAGNRPIALIGGGTTMIGDPSGRTDMRKMLTKEDIAHNAACFKQQMEQFHRLLARARL